MPRITFGSFKVDQVPTWVVVLSIFVITLGGMFYAYDVWMKDPRMSLVTAEQANAKLRAEVIEYGVHIAESPEMFAVLRNDVRGRLTVAAYSDECSILSLSKNGKVRSKLILSLAREVEITETLRSPQLVATVYASGRCLNPHPGQFRTWYGERDGEWIQVWRLWPDGCKHVQMFNVVRGVWDTNQDGTPRVRWTWCVH